jgi:hypothetical protein
MVTRSKIAVIATIAALSCASPAFAQSFSRTDGTGVPSYYDSQGGLHVGIPTQQNQIAIHRNGLNAFARIPNADGAADASDSPAATGGGSIGYNRMLREEW